MRDDFRKFNLEHLENDEELCDECDGRGSTIENPYGMCDKCHGHGTVTWIEQVFGKDNPSLWKKNSEIKIQSNHNLEVGDVVTMDSFKYVKCKPKTQWISGIVSKVLSKDGFILQITENF